MDADVLTGSGQEQPSVQAGEDAQKDTPSPSSSPKPVALEGTQTAEVSTGPSQAQEDADFMMRLQQEYLRASMRSSGPVPPPPTQAVEEGAGAEAINGLASASQIQKQMQQPPQQPGADPMLEMLTGLLGGGNPSAVPGNFLGAAPTQTPPKPSMTSSLMSSAISAATSAASAATLPTDPFVQRRNTTWKWVHAAFALVTSIYMIFILQSSINEYGGGEGDAALPPPPKARNPALLLVLGEILLMTVRALLGEGFQAQKWKLLGDLWQDCKVMIFFLGAYTLWFAPLIGAGDGQMAT